MLLGTTALATLGLAACANNSTDGLAGAAEIGQFGIVVGEPVAVISATRGQGASVDFDQFTVTFNNAEGTSITIGTPEGEEITFEQDDPDTWVGYDDDLDTELARLTSANGDHLEVMIGEVRVPVAPEPDTENGAQASRYVETTDQLAYAAARLDENDTRDGFETYAVVGDLTDPANLPRFAEDVFENVEGEQVLVHSAGDLIEGTAYYHGDFLATVFKEGEVVSDAVTGGVGVSIDFESSEVDIWMEGSYEFDDVDDQANAVTGITLATTDIDGFTYVTGVDLVYDNANAAESVITGFTVTTDFTIHGEEFVTGVTPIFGSITDNDTFVSDVELSTDVFDGITVVTGIANTFRESDNGDDYYVYLSGSGNSDDIDFDSGVTYTGELDGDIDVPYHDHIHNVDVAGEFGGAVFGPGESAFDVLEEFDPDFHDIVSATATAGVLEANSEGNDEGEGDPAVEIVGVFGAGAGCGECIE